MKPVNTIRVAEYRKEALASVTEEALQQQVMTALQLAGVTVLQTSEHRKRGAERSGRGCSPGVPDLLMRAPHWHNGVWLGVELKRPIGGRLSPAQKQLHTAGAIVVARSLYEVLDVFLAVWEYCGYTQTDESRRMYDRLFKLYSQSDPNGALQP